MRLKYKIITLLCLFLMIFQTISFASSPTINSKAAILVEVSTGRILYEKNSTKQLYPASTTKIMTGILALEYGNLNDVYVVPENGYWENPYLFKRREETG